METVLLETQEVIRELNIPVIEMPELARILEACKEVGCSLLISDDFMKHLSMLKIRSD